MPSNPLILCHPFSSCLQSFPVLVFSSELAFRIRWPKYRNFGFRISPPSEYSGLISFRMDWFELIAVQGTRKSLLQLSVRKDQLFGPQPSLWFNSYIPT